jgi:hypothetical protein
MGLLFPDQGGLVLNQNDINTNNLTSSPTSPNNINDYGIQTDGSSGSLLGGSGGTYSGGGGSTAPSYSQDDLNYLNDQEGQLNHQMGRTDTTLQNSLAAILNNYNNEVSGANKQRGRALEDFSTKEQTSEFGRARELGKNDTRARSLANSLRQRIGLASGGGSSAYQQTAPGAVARQASEGRQDILGNYAANFMNLATDKKRATEDFDSLLNSLSEQKLQREGGVVGDIEEQRNSIRSNQANLAAERAKLLGGGYDQVRTARAPWEQQIRGGEGTIDGIFNKYTTKYNVKPVEVKNTQLRDYMTDQVAVRDNAATGNNSEYAPYKTYLDKEEEQLA